MRKCKYVYAVVFMMAVCIHAGEIALVIDTSGSMAGSRIQEAKAAANTIINRLGPSDYLSIRVFDGCSTRRLASMESVTASRKQALKGAINSLSASGLTPLYQSVVDARADFLGNTADKRIILLTDGVESCGGSDLSNATYWTYQGKNIQTWIIAYNTTLTASLKQAAQKGRGQALSANNLPTLVASLNKAISSGGAKAPTGLIVTGPGVINRGNAPQFRAKLLYTDGSQTDVTSTSTFLATPQDFVQENYFARGRVFVRQPVFWVMARRGQFAGALPVIVK